jgi:hypothetical protein
LSTDVDATDKISINLNRDMSQAHPPMTRRETIHGGSTPASMRVMVIGGCARFMSLAVNGTAVIHYSLFTVHCSLLTIHCFTVHDLCLYPDAAVPEHLQSGR